MTESLIPERPVIVSPSLAASIGLEEAILLQHLESVLALGMGETRDGYHWTTTQLSTLTQQLPFWTTAALRRILNNLVDLGMVLVKTMPKDENQTLELTINQQVRYQRHNQPSSQATPSASLGAQRISANWRPDRAILDQLNQQGIDLKFVEANIDEFVFYWRERNEASHAWSSKFLQHVSRRWQTHQHHLQEAAVKLVTPPKHQTPIAKQWQPSPDAVEILERMGINRNFIDDAVAEFILYWQERKEAQSTWNSKFVNHVKRQWARFTHTLKHDTEPRPITEQWKPDHEVFDVLTIANIDSQFARNLIPEFVLFWRDKNELHHSWNTKFLQHVKYRWARRNDNQTGAKGDTFERLTDRSWAADLIK
jgi:hypothetical protein